jgi:hypothetical protein
MGSAWGIYNESRMMSKNSLKMLLLGVEREVYKAGKVMGRFYDLISQILM